MTKLFRPEQCPKCRHNNDNIACMNSLCDTLPGETYHYRSRQDWTIFKGTTNRKCGCFHPKDKSDVPDKMQGDKQK